MTTTHSALPVPHHTGLPRRDRSPRTLARLLAVIGGLAATLVLVVAPTPAQAHSGTQSYVYLQIFDDAIFGRVEYPIVDLNRVVGFDVDEDDTEAALEDLEAQRDRLVDYTASHLSLYPEDGAPGDWTFEFTEVSVLEESNGNYGIIDFEIEDRFDPTPRRFNIDYDGIIEGDSDRDAFLLIETDFGSGTFNNEAGTLLRFTPDTTTQLVDLDDSSFWKGVRGTIGLGAEHIQIGTDHILFVLALVLPSVLVFTRREPGGTDDGDTDGAAALASDRGEWQPSPSFGASLWRVLKIVTMFTIAHSITLAIGGFEVFDLSPRLVESIIAISIAIAALHNIRPIWANKEWAMAFGFGLFHGFGFAGLLSELGLTRTNRVVSLLGFNIGVEIGQAAIILMVFPILFVMRRTRVFVPLMKIGSVFLALVALAWATERIFDYDTDVNALVDPILRWPRSALLLAAAFAAACGLYAYDRSRDALLPVASDADGANADDRSDELVDA